MEKNTVNLCVDYYNTLRDFNEAIRKGGCVVIGRDPSRYREEVYTENKFIEKVAKINEKLIKEINELRDGKKEEPSVKELKQQIERLKEEIYFLKSIRGKEPKNNSFWSFIK